jgi:hypothetical protein
MMKIFLPFAFLAVACEAMAQEDAQCTRERAAMVEISRISGIRAGPTVPPTLLAMADDSIE